MKKILSLIGVLVLGSTATVPAAEAPKKTAVRKVTPAEAPTPAEPDARKIEGATTFKMENPDQDKAFKIQSSPEDSLALKHGGHKASNGVKITESEINEFGNIKAPTTKK